MSAGFGGSLLCFWSQGLPLNPASELATLAGHLSPSTLLSPSPSAEIAGSIAKSSFLHVAQSALSPIATSSSAHGWSQQAQHAIWVWLCVSP